MALPGYRLEELERLCRERDIGVTLQRRAVLEVLLARDDHPTADEVHVDVVGRFKGVSRATVYRTLETLVEQGLLVRVCHPEAATRYDVRTHRHHHLVCDRCGRITDFDAPSLDHLPLAAFTTGRFRVRDYSVHVRGLCEECTDAPARGGPGTRSDGARPPTQPAKGNEPDLGVRPAGQRHRTPRGGSAPS